MAIDPKFSATRFQNAMGKALGTMGAAYLRSTLVQAGQQHLMDSGRPVTVRDAKTALKVMENKGQLTGEQAAYARAVMKKEEIVAGRLARNREQDFKKENLARFNQEKQNDSVVREVKHSVSAFDKTQSTHLVSASQKTATHSVSAVGRTTKTSVSALGRVAGANAVASQKPKSTFIDLAIG